MRQQNSLKSVLKLVERGGGRSTLFYWMVDHHDQLMSAWSTQSVRWAPLCARFQELELTDGKGAPPSVHCAMVTWRKVRRAVQKARTEMASAKKSPARAPAQRLARSTATPPPAPPSCPPSPGADPAAETEAEAEARAEANIEHMLRTVAERSGRARPDRRTS